MVGAEVGGEIILRQQQGRGQIRNLVEVQGVGAGDRRRIDADAGQQMAGGVDGDATESIRESGRLDQLRGGVDWRNEIEGRLDQGGRVPFLPESISDSKIEAASDRTAGSQLMDARLSPSGHAGTGRGEKNDESGVRIIVVNDQERIGAAASHPK